jgi:PTS system cellobiose-specific IIB component
LITITLLCSLGMSTSMLVDNMKGAAEARGVEIDIDALPFQNADGRLAQTDILLFSPQIRHLLPKFKEKYAGSIPVIGTIDISDYGLLRGEKILTACLAQWEASRGAS